MEFLRNNLKIDMVNIPSIKIDYFNSLFLEIRKKKEILSPKLYFDYIL